MIKKIFFCSYCGKFLSIVTSLLNTVLHGSMLVKKMIYFMNLFINNLLSFLVCYHKFSLYRSLNTLKCESRNLWQCEMGLNIMICKLNLDGWIKFPTLINSLFILRNDTFWYRMFTRLQRSNRISIWFSNEYAQTGMIKFTC